MITDVIIDMLILGTRSKLKGLRESPIGMFAKPVADPADIKYNHFFFSSIWDRLPILIAKKDTTYAMKNKNSSNNRNIIICTKSI